MNLTLPKTMSNQQKADSIEPEFKNLIKKASNSMKGKLHPQESDMRFLFKMFDEKITHYPIDKINCNDCRVMVRDFWQHIVEQWN